MTADSVVSNLSGYLTNQALSRILVTIIVISFSCFFLAGLLRLMFGRRGTAVGAVTVILDILVLYVLVVLLSKFIPVTEKYLPALPFATFNAGGISFIPVPEIEKTLLAAELVNLVILTFLFGLAEDLLPEGKNILSWFLLRLVTLVVVCTAIWVINWLFSEITPNLVQVYAPIILLVLLLALLAVTVLKWLISVILGLSCGPFIGAIYAFFVGNIIGRQLIKATLASALILLLLTLAYQNSMLNINLDEFPMVILSLILFAPVTARYLITKLF